MTGEAYASCRRPKAAKPDSLISLCASDPFLAASYSNRIGTSFRLSGPGVGFVRSIRPVLSSLVYTWRYLAIVTKPRLCREGKASAFELPFGHNLLRACHFQNDNAWLGCRTLTLRGLSRRGSNDDLASRCRKGTHQLIERNVRCSSFDIGFIRFERDRKGIELSILCWPSGLRREKKRVLLRRGLRSGSFSFFYEQTRQAS